MFGTPQLCGLPQSHDPVLLGRPNSQLLLVLFSILVESSSVLVPFSAIVERVVQEQLAHVLYHYLALPCSLCDDV